MLYCTVGYILFFGTEKNQCQLYLVGSFHINKNVKDLIFSDEDKRKTKFGLSGVFASPFN